MKLTEEAKTAIQKNANLKKELIYHLANTSTTLYRWLDKNEENGMLTTVRAVEIIKEFGKMKAKDILTKKNTE